jgi:hypothetical protein
MNLQKIKLLAAMLTAVTIIGFVSSCKKDNDEEIIDSDPTSFTEENSEAEFFSNDALNMSDAAANGEQKFRGGNDDMSVLSGCATVNKDSANKTITIDFGTSYCLCKDGRYRKGIINIVYTGGKYADSASSRTVSFTDYYVARDTTKWKKISGSKTVTNNGRNTAGNWNWTIQGNNIRIDKHNGNWHTWSFTRNREQIAGSGTKTVLDDTYMITGGGSGQNSKGENYSSSIKTALKRVMTCPWFESGVVEVTPGNKPTRTIDYGTTGCDATATITVKGKTYTVTLP